MDRRGAREGDEERGQLDESATADDGVDPPRGECRDEQQRDDDGRDLGHPGSLAHAVVAVEQDAEMGATAQTRLAASGADNVAVVQAKLTVGAPAQAPYDAILIGGGVEQMPDAMADQLAEGGRIIALWIEGALGTVRLGTRLDGRLAWRFAFHAHAPVLPGFAHQRGFAL